MTIETKVHFTTERAGQKRMRNGALRLQWTSYHQSEFHVLHD